MKTLSPILLFVLLLVGVVAATHGVPTSVPDGLSDRTGAGNSGPSTAPSGDAGSVRFEAVHVFVDPGDRPLAAYQFEVTATSGDVKLVGLEGGEHAAFKSPPYYDPQALLNNKVVVAAFSTADDLPHGRTRVATLMVQVAGPAEPDFAGKLQVAASADGKPIDAHLIVTPVH
jgi:hypothetical protein